MRRFAVFVLAFSCAFVLGTSVHASALSLLSGDGDPDFLEDDDWELFVDADGNRTFGPDGDGSIDAGDYVIGMIEISAVNNVGIGAGSSTFTAILAAKIAEINPFTSQFVGGTTMSFEAIPALEYAALQAGDFSNLPTRNSDASAVLVFDGSRGDLEQGDGTGDPNDRLATAQQGPLLAEFGFVTDPGDADAFSEADFNPTLSSFNFEGGLNLTFNGTSLTFLKHNELSNGVAPEFRFGHNQGTGDRHHLQFVGQPGGDTPGDFDINTDTDMYLNPVPEPASLILLAMGGLGLFGIGYRFRWSEKLAANDQAA